MPPKCRRIMRAIETIGATKNFGIRKKLFEQNRLMLEKVEEAYLYILQLGKENEYLKKRIADLEAKETVTADRTQP